jgi:excisionase family DNA binding protein
MSTETTAPIASYRKVKDVAREWGVTPQHVRNLVASGRIAPAYRVGNLILIPQESISAFIEHAAVKAKAA